jgi:UDP-N-acetylmuramoyl-L-alanyl-D-glutamate--2,6-diaminopimelate ligase
MNKHHPPTTNLTQLLSDFVTLPAELSLNITGLSCDSQSIQPGDLFICCFGPKAQHAEFMQTAIAKGAVAVLQDCTYTLNSIFSVKDAIPIINISDLRSKVGLIAASFFGQPSSHMKVLGITGTNGKTSCSQFIAQALEQAGQHCGIIGTIGSGFPGRLNTATLTTPDPVTLQQTLAQLQHQGANYIAMEVSSHSLDQNRIAGVHFDTAIFTNLTRDHLDYHGDMENYAQAKRKLFLQPDLKHIVINADDAFGQKLITEFAGQLPCYSYSITGNIQSKNNILANEIKLNSQGFSAHVDTPWGQGILHSRLMGRFNLSNLLAVLAALGIMHIPLADILEYISTLTNVPGRMQTFGGGKLPLVVVDYAHTPDALQKALTALREHCHGKLWCVFGCGGDRDAGKRPIMGQMAERFSDQVIITDDNPRFESPQSIVENILAGLLCPWAVEVEHNRHAAIAHAIECAQPGDVVLIAGKGHETYQQIGEARIPFNDAQEVQAQLIGVA